MPDFPASMIHPNRVTTSTFGRNSLFGVDSMLQNLNATAGAAWPANNRALYMPLWIEETMVGRRLIVLPTTASGNLDVGIYDYLGNRIVSKGSTAVGTANTAQVIDITTSVTGTASPVLTPGTYFVALSCSTTAAAFKSSTMSLAEMCRISGLQQENLGSVTLPATATFSNPAAAYAPVIVLSAGTAF